MRHEELIKKDVDKQNERINDRVQRRKSGLNRSGYGSFIGEPSKPSFTAKEKAKEIWLIMCWVTTSRNFNI